MTSDSGYMRRALELAERACGMTNPNPMVGAVLVRDGKIIGEGYHHRAGEAHAEVNAFADAEKRGESTEGSTLYVTLEPCSSYGRTPPCTERILNSGVKRVVIGCLDPNPKHNGKAVAILEKAGISVSSGVEEAACFQLNRAFFCWISTGKPWVVLKMATTLDGKTAAPSGDSFWVTGELARARVQELRRMSDAIMVGANTVRLDHPKLNVRIPESWPRQPLRLVASGSMTEDELATYFPDGNAELADPASEGWENFLLRLGKRKIMMLLLEGGAELAGSALSAGAVDHVEFHIAPKILGGRNSHPAVGGEDPGKMLDALALENVKVSRYGDDVAVSGDLKKREK
ncbi:MAG: bifunctional diaminohydroxyphosphoribosylaminopyrimidine deaminase/5-amino-6-(5-phosphoribosylamino)uracil reductase RibD [Lentisphaeria bacterium]|nr:bifunctional diaminohydroxyphosphoribosylaminopyrimidine deaminase/5-amino-6-(5-phosphoribosylamino)uracil reductase RibD [Lentisphaeria bacterium]